MTTIQGLVSEWKFGDNLPGQPSPEIQAAKALKPTDPREIHPAIRKKAVLDLKAAEKAKEPEAPKSDELKDLVKKAREQFKKHADAPSKSDDKGEGGKKSVEPESQRFSRWLSSPGKSKFESVQEEVDRAEMHTHVANNLKRIGYNPHAIKAKRKLARQYRKIQQP